MKTSWTAGLSPQDKEEIVLAFKASARLRERLISMLEDKANVSRTAARRDENYENPAWPYQQADKLGYERAIFEVISLLSSKSAD